MGQTLTKIRSNDQRAARAVESAAVRSPRSTPSIIARKAELHVARKKAKERAKALKRSSLAGSTQTIDNEKRARKEAKHKKALAVEEEQKKQNEHDRLRERKWAKEKSEARREREQTRKRAAMLAKMKQKKQRKVDKRS